MPLRGALGGGFERLSALQVVLVAQRDAASRYMVSKNQSLDRESEKMCSSSSRKFYW